MKKLLLVLFLALGACAPLREAFEVGTVVTASVQNPVTPAMLYDVENGLRIVAAGLVTYRRACIAGTADANCRDTIARIQPYTRSASVAIVQLRQYLRTNDQINAISAYNTLRRIITDINAARGV